VHVNLFNEEQVPTENNTIQPDLFNGPTVYYSTHRRKEGFLDLFCERKGEKI